jgi:DNA (cytosine-5)-methyltransferase 1
MDFLEKIKIEDLGNSKVKVRLIEPVNNKMAVITHYLHNNTNGVSKKYKKDAQLYVKEYLENNYPDEKITSKVAESAIQYLLLDIDNIPFPAPEKPLFKFIDLFAGIGGFRMAMQNLGGKCVFTSEWDKYSQKTYQANFGEVPFGDITKTDTQKFIPDEFDILCAGFPCQPFSIAGVSKKNSLGKKHGFLDETQGTLFFDLAQILKTKQPPCFILENVKNLVSHDKGRTFKVITETLKELGYNIHCKVLDGKHYVPQHRERIIIVGFRNEIFNKNEKFVFPEPTNTKYSLRNILDKKVDKKYTLSNHLWNYLQEYSRKHKEKGNGFGFGLADLNSISRTMSARYYKDGAEILIPQLNESPRRLTPRECARLQGYPDNFIIPVSDNQAYKQFGNSVVMPLIQAIGENIINELLKNNESRKSKINILSKRM